MMGIDTYSQIASQIIKEQEGIIGPIALEQARKVDGLVFVDQNSVKVVGNAKDVLQHLVDQYSMLFGRASVEVCRDAVRGIIGTVSKDDIPQVLL